MDTTKETRDVDIDPDTTGLMALLELRELLATELDVVEGTDSVQRVFRPLTDGLGLESPRKREGSLAKPAASVAARKPAAEPQRSKVATEPNLFSEEDFSFEQAIQDRVTNPPTETGLAAFMAPPEVAPADPEPEKRALPLSDYPEATPPPVPRPSWMRRFLAGLMDELFVLTLFGLAMVVTLWMLSGGRGFHLTHLKGMENPVFIRFAILEFATIWISYFAICVGILDMTFGMWVWGIRLGYGLEVGEMQILRKGLRVLLSFIFYAPVFPLTVLAIQVRGRNLLDFLTGTNLYRTMA
jgi:RDD family